ncbi:hypothetical protein F5Y15DRAFT_26646 [Xylariaceae sp. FL0016]|nr:hypothetical protein F5Y15DRAFT_26646 [Xylariaceae sp. FL0016]
MAPAVARAVLAGLNTNIFHRTPDQTNTPTRTLPDLVSRVIVRQVVTTTTAVVNNNNNGGTNLSGGAIAGIVIGSIVGFLLLLWLIRSCLNLGHPGIWGSTFEPSEEKPSSAYPDRHHHHHHRRHRSRSRHSHHRHGHHSPSRRVSVVSTTTTRPVYVEPRGRSPRAPPVAYYQQGREMDGRDLRRASDSRRYRRY